MTLFGTTLLFFAILFDTDRSFIMYQYFIFGKFRILIIYFWEGLDHFLKFCEMGYLYTFSKNDVILSSKNLILV